MSATGSSVALIGEAEGDTVRAGDVVDGKYAVRGVIGRGGVGIVVAAHHTALDVPVALKLLRRELANDREIRARFVREARASVKLRGDHVARVMDAGVSGEGLAFLAMELLDGRDFAAILKTDGALAVDDAVDYVIQACDAVAEAHANGIVHRDLKSANLFLTRAHDGTPLVKVLDFGLSKLEGSGSRSGLTSEHHVFGSLHFMSPEQMRATRDADTRSDIWALGVVLYAFLTGRVPFAGKFLTEVCAAVLEGAPPSIASLRPGVPAGLEAVVMRCLCLEPSERFQSVTELARALLPFAPERSARHVARIERLLPARASLAPQPPAVAVAVPVAAPVIAKIAVAPRRARWPFVAAFTVIAGAAAIAFAAPPDLVSARAEIGGDVAAGAALFVASIPTAPVASSAPPAASLVLPTPIVVPASPPRTSRPAPPAPGKTKSDEDLIMKLPH